MLLGVSDQGIEFINHVCTLQNVSDIGREAQNFNFMLFGIL